jgi:DNA polymerase I-like protein with 3'-5' exonuclease and polymerase domains/uracil-DNA glycosylase
MGFFDMDTAPPKPAAKSGPKVRAKQIAAGAKGCDACPMQRRWSQLLTPRMRISGPADADVLVLGAAPNDFDDKRGKPFESDHGKMISSIIPGHDKNRIAYGYMTRCASEPGKEIDKAAVHACSIHLAEDIARGSYKAILGVGDIPLHHFAPGQFTYEAFGLRFPISIGDKQLWYYPVHDQNFVERLKGRYDDGPAMPILRSDIKRLFRNLDKWERPAPVKLDPAQVIIAKSYADGIELLDAMEGKIGLDFESNMLKPYMIGSQLITGAASDGELTMAWVIEHPEDPNDWGARLALHIAQTRPWIAHNAAMELIWLIDYAKRLGIEPRFQPFDDTMALARLYFERAGMSGLDSVSLIVLGHDVKQLLQVRAARIMEYPLAEVLPYNGLDAQASALIYRRLIDRVNARPYAALLGSVRSTTEMEYRGLTVALEESAALRSIWEAKRHDEEDRAPRIYEAREFQENEGRAFRISAPEDVGLALAKYGKLALPMTPKGKQYQTDDAVLNKLAPDNPLVMSVLAYREANKLISTYIDPIERAHNVYSDGLLHPSYTTMLTRTGRLSSNDPNIQNFPKRKFKELRRQIKARYGHLFFAFDYGQLEARIIAMASRDAAFCKAILNGFDVHGYWLDRLLAIEPSYLDRLAIETNLVGSDPKRIRKAGRDIIKTDFVFASFFGSGVKSISDRTKLTANHVTELLADFWVEYSGAKKWVQERRNEYKEYGTSHTLTGRVRHEVLLGNEPLNNPIQGTGADIVVDSMNALAAYSHEVDDPYFHPRINIHDDLIFELPEANADQYISKIMDEMVTVRYDFQIVPLMVEARVGSDWADLEEFTTHTGDWVRR